MPTKPETVKELKDINGADILNVTRSAIGGQYEKEVPKAIKAGEKMANGKIATKQDSLMSLRAIGSVINGYDVFYNQFLTNLVNRIGLVMITSRLYENPWSKFKRGVLEYGETVEEIFVSLAQGYQFDQEDSETTLFERYNPDVKAEFHSLNFQKFYPCTITIDVMRQAFLSWDGLNDMITRIIEQVYTGANYDEFMVMKYMIARLALDGNIHAVQVPEVNAENARMVTAEIATKAKDLTFMSTKYNRAKVYNYTDPNFLYTILTNSVSSIFDVEVLALSFNIDKSRLIGMQSYVDSFGEINNERLALIFKDDPYTTFTPFTDEELEKLKSIQALMCDVNFFMIFDNLLKMTSVENAKGLYQNYFLHKWTTFSTSPFANAMIFVTTEQSVTSVSVTPTTASVSKGQTVQFTTNVEGSGFVNGSVNWSVNSDNPNTYIDSNGLLRVSQAETETTLTITATSSYDESKTGTATVTVI